MGLVYAKVTHICRLARWRAWARMLLVFKVTHVCGLARRRAWASMLLVGPAVFQCDTYMRARATEGLG